MAIASSTWAEILVSSDLGAGRTTGGQLLREFGRAAPLGPVAAPWTKQVPSDMGLGLASGRAHL